MPLGAESWCASAASLEIKNGSNKYMYCSSMGEREEGKVFESFYVSYLSSEISRSNESSSNLFGNVKVT